MSGRDDRIRELYENALKQSIGERAIFVAAHSRGDDDLKRRVDALLAGQHDTHIEGHEPNPDGRTDILVSGTEIGHYRIDGPLGAGGMGVVYRATDTKLNRPAAIKVLPETLADPEARRRFQREAQMVSSLNHPHIVTVYDAGEYQERQYLITEYVDGGTLRQWAARPRGWLAIVELLVGVADAVASAHEAGILHRDIKPENILLAKNGYAKLADFGLAKLFEVDPLADDAFAGIAVGVHSTLMGTVGYMSPEQAEGRALDGRSDVYSFGLVLHELLSGTRPSAGQVQRHGDAPAPFPPLPADVPADLRGIVAKALEREPADRYQTMHDFVVDLRRVVRRSGVEGQTGVASEGVAGPIATGVAPVRTRFRTSYMLAGLASLVISASVATYYGLGLGAPSNNAVAVLPFVNESGSDDDHISAGLGDDLRSRLMGVPGLDVQGRASSVSVRELGAEPRAVASRLGVNVLVNGSLRRRGDTLIVLVEALNADGVLLQSWPPYERSERELLALQQTIAADVAVFLAPETAPAAPVATPTRESESANMLVLLGTHFEQQVTDDISVDEEKLDRAIDLYRQATVADPQSVAAHSRLARALIYRGDIDEASAHLRTARDLGDGTPTATPAELSDTYYTSALYLLASQSAGVEQSYQTAIRLNPNNTDALGAYAQWLMIHSRTPDAGDFFRAALQRDRQQLARYVDYAEYLAIVENMDEARLIGEEIRARFPDTRGYLALARLHETTGDLDVGIAWGLQAYREDPRNADTAGQVAELYARIGDLDTAAEYEPEFGIGQLNLRRDYRRLIEEAALLIIERPEEMKLRYTFAFALNATGDSKSAVSILERSGMPIKPAAEYITAAADEALTTYIDALLAVGGRDTEALALADDKRVLWFDPALANSWWVATYQSCTLAQLGRLDEALAALEGVVRSQGLGWSWFLQDALCFRRVAGHPRYQAVISHLEARQAQLRERLPATLLAHGVADVQALAAR